MADSFILKSGDSKSLSVGTVVRGWGAGEGGKGRGTPLKCWWIPPLRTLPRRVFWHRLQRAVDWGRKRLRQRKNHMPRGVTANYHRNLDARQEVKTTRILGSKCSWGICPSAHTGASIQSTRLYNAWECHCVSAGRGWLTHRSPRLRNPKWVDGGWGQRHLISAALGAGGLSVYACVCLFQTEGIK